MSASAAIANATARTGAAYAHGSRMVEQAIADGVYVVDYWMPEPARLDEWIALRDELAALTSAPVILLQSLERIHLIRSRMSQLRQDLVWSDTIYNTVVTEGKNAALTHYLKGSTYTASQALGLIEDTGYTAIAAGNTAANITAAGGGSPANGWNEAPSATCAARQTPSFGTAGSGSLAASATSHSTLATDTIKGAFLVMRSTAGTAPSTTVGNTSGALYSAGTFSGGDQAVSNGGTLQVTYTASL